MSICPLTDSPTWEGYSQQTTPASICFVGTARKNSERLVVGAQKNQCFPTWALWSEAILFFAFHLQALSHGIMMLTAWIWINPLDQENQSKLQRTKKNKKNTVCGLLGSRNVQTSLENMVFLSFVFLWFVLVSLGLFDSVGLIQIYPNHMI